MCRNPEVPLEGWVCHQLELPKEHTLLQQGPDQPYCIVHLSRIRDTRMRIEKTVVTYS